MSLHEFNRYTAVFMLSLRDRGWFSPRTILKIDCEKEKKKKKDKNHYVRDRILSRF